MTPLGIVRFLDNFNDLYGNKLDPTARQIADSALEAVIMAFSCQWNPGSKAPEPDSGRAASIDVTGSRLFFDAWLKAHSSLSEAQHIRSFRIIYATFLFSLTVVPVEASFQLKQDVDSHEFLDCGLRHLCDLERLVTGYCETLGATSVYATLVESSLNIIRWFGYVRDTVSSLTSNRPCFLPDYTHKSIGNIILHTIKERLEANMIVQPLRFHARVFTNERIPSLRPFLGRS